MVSRSPISMPGRTIMTRTRGGAHNGRGKADGEQLRQAARPARPGLGFARRALVAYALAAAANDVLSRQSICRLVRRRTLPGYPKELYHQPKHRIALWLPILLTALLASINGAAQTQVLSPISEETPPAVCRSGSFISGIRCTGRYCDNIEITCTQLPGAMVGADHRWTPWTSEESTSPAWCGPGPNLIEAWLAEVDTATTFLFIAYHL